MNRLLIPARPRGVALLLGWRRIVFTLGIALGFGLLLSLGWKSGTLSLLAGGPWRRGDPARK